MASIQHPAAVVIGASGGIGAAVAGQLEGSGRFAVVHALSRAGTGFDLEDEASIAAAAARVADGPAPALVFVATGVLHDGYEPERSWRALDAEHLLRDYRINAVGPALVAKHFLPLLPRDRRAVFTALSARVGSIGDNRLGGWHSYRASKAALNMILRNLAVELGRTHPQAVVAGLHPRHRRHRPERAVPEGGQAGEAVHGGSFGGAAAGGGRRPDAGGQRRRLRLGRCADPGVISAHPLRHPRA